LTVRPPASFHAGGQERQTRDRPLRRPPPARPDSGPALRQNGHPA